MMVFKETLLSCIREDTVFFFFFAIVVCLFVFSSLENRIEGLKESALCFLNGYYLYTAFLFSSVLLLT